MGPMGRSAGHGEAVERGVPTAARVTVARAAPAKVTINRIGARMPVAMGCDGACIGAAKMAPGRQARVIAKTAIICR